MSNRRSRLLVLCGLLSISAEALAAPEPPAFRLVDEARNPYFGVRVSVVGRTGAVTTDQNGIFRLAPEPTPPFELAVFDERGALLGVIQIDSLDQPGSRELVLSPISQDKVTVLSRAAPSTFAPPAAAASVFSSVESRERRPAQLVEALKEIPGASQIGSGPAAVPSLRGLARGRTLILLDDARVTSERRAGPSATFLDPFSLESVEIIRGPGSVMYGSDALGGIIHARTPMPRAEEFSGRFEVSAGVGEEIASAALEVNVPAGAGVILAQGHLRSSGDYASPAGTVDNSSSRDRGVLLRGTVPAGGTRMLFGLQLDRGRDIGKPSADSDGARTVYPTEDSDRLTLGVDLPGFGGFSAVELRAFLGAYRLVTDRETLPSAGSIRTIERSDVDAKDSSLRLVGTRPIRQGMLRLGIDVASRFDLQARNLLFEQQPGEPLMQVREELSIESARRIDGGLFAEVERVLPKLPGSLAAGLRGDRVETRSSGGTFGRQSTSNGALSGYLALTFHPAKDWSASVQYAQGFRDPLLSDRYFEGVTGRGTIVGNPDLTPETSDQYDLAVHTTLGPVRIAGYGYLYRIQNLVERFPVPGQEDVFNFRNRGEAELRGLELESDVELPLGLDMRVTLNYARGEILDDGSSTTDVPPESVSVSLRRRVAQRYWWRLSYSLYARDNDPGSTEAVTPGYGVLDASAGYDLGAEVEARVFLGNLTDKTYPGSSDASAPLAPGRSLAFVLAGKF